MVANLGEKRIKWHASQNPRGGIDAGAFGVSGGEDVGKGRTYCLQGMLRGSSGVITQYVTATQLSSRPNASARFIRALDERHIFDIKNSGRGGCRGRKIGKSSRRCWHGLRDDSGHRTDGNCGRRGGSGGSRAGTCTGAAGSAGHTRKARAKSQLGEGSKHVGM